MNVKVSAKKISVTIHISHEFSTRSVEVCKEEGSVVEWSVISVGGLEGG